VPLRRHLNGLPRRPEVELPEYPVTADALSRRYATAGSDGGHQGGSADASFWGGHPEKSLILATALSTR